MPSQIRLLDAKQTQQKSREEIEVIRLQCISESVSFVLSRGVGDVTVRKWETRRSLYHSLPERSTRKYFVRE